MKRKLFGLLLILTLLITPVYAETINEKGTNFLSDQNLNIDKDIDGNLFAAGNTISVDSNVNGLSFVAGNIITVSKSHDYLFAAGNSIGLNDVNSKDTFVAGQSIEIKNSDLRDVFIAGEKVYIESTTIRNAFIGGEKVEIQGEISGDIKVDASELIIKEGTIISGKLSINESAKIDKASDVNIETMDKYKDTNISIKINPVELIIGKIIERIISYVSLLLVAIIILVLYKKVYANIKKLEKEENFVLKSLGLGFLVLICVPIISGILLITVIGIPSSLILLTLYIMAIYLSAIPSSYYVGNILFKNKIKNDYLLLTVSLLIYFVLSSIPLIGGLLKLVSLIFGLGIILYLVKPTFKKEKK